MSLQEFNNDQLPQHIAIIMDGNGRWAQQQGKNRLRGHEAGAKQYEIQSKQLQD